KPLARMPEGLRRHIRYPEDFFAIQARKYATYNMLDPQVFYNKEDLWAVPRRAIEGRDRDMEPYFTIMRLPGEQKEEFILLTLFNPARRDNMIAWMAARSDPPNYGRLIVFNFPKQKLVYGPRQIDARIDQDPIISQQLSLWNQRGSSVIRGSLLAIPIDQSLIYVQPLYLASSQPGALHELRRVIVAYGHQHPWDAPLDRSVFGAPAPMQWLRTLDDDFALVRDGALRGEWVTAASSDQRAILYLHGGGYVAGSPASHRPITAALARLARRRVFSLDY